MLLLDEPFGALDAKVRSELRIWLRRFHDELHVTSIFVTHDQEEAFEVADRVVVMNKGKIEQDGTPIEVFEHPATAFVMDFLGNVNKLPVRVEGGRALLGETSQVEVPAKLFETGEKGRADAYIRPSHELDISRSADSGKPSFACKSRSPQSGRIHRESSRSGRGSFGLMITVDISPEHFKGACVETG